MSELFNGKWRIDLDGSTRWDPNAQMYVPDEVGDELILLDVKDGVQNYEVLYGDSPTIRMGYTSRYDDATWTRYEVREIFNIGDSGEEEAVEAFRRRIGAGSGTGYRQFAIGECYALVRTIYVDERTHYRVAKYPDSGEPQAMMLRRMAEDSASYLASVMDVDGVVYRIRRFVRADGS